MSHMSKWFGILSSVGFWLVATTALAQPAKQAKAAPPAYAPKPEDARLARGRAFVERTTLANSVLNIAGTLPTPCHEIRVKMPTSPDPSGTAALEVYSVFASGKMCAQMLQPFSIQVPLSEPITKAKITVNGKPAGGAIE